MDTFSKQLLNMLMEDLNGHQIVTTDCYSGLSARSVALSRLLESFVKKHEPETSQEEATAVKAAEDLFLECNRRCASVDFPDSVRNFAHRIWWDFPDCWDEYLKHSTLVGPGSSVSSRGKNDFARKFFSNDHTVTSEGLYSEVYRHLNFQYRARLKGSENHFQMSRALLDYKPKIVRGATFFTVPKDKRISRCAATEPAINMACQLGVGGFINTVLSRRWGYSPELQQDRNRAMAKIGSLDLSLATIDLSSASDLIPLTLVRKMLPPNLVAAIEDCRSPVVNIAGREIALHMVSTMGNGFTFPLETLIFTLICEHVARQKGIALTRMDALTPNFGVFGDDIVVPSGIYVDVIRALTMFGMDPNPKKSFGGDLPFRESCGRDYWCGENVRAVYLKTTATDADIYSAINRIIRHATLWGYAPRKTIALLRSRLSRPLHVPRHLADSAGIHIPYPKAGLLSHEYLEPAKNDLTLANKRGDLRLGDYRFLWCHLGGYVCGNRILLRQGVKTKYMRKTLPRRLWDTRTSFHFELSKGAYRLIEKPFAWYDHHLPDLGWSERVFSLL